MERTSCCIVGGGPAGMVLGLLLARAGVEVTVLEKHADFLRDFRGDTVHPSTLQLLDELGLIEEFLTLPHRKVETAGLPGNGSVIGLSRLPSRYPYVALAPQWDLLNLLARAADEESTFTLRMSTEVTELTWEGNRVTGVRYTDATGERGQLQADLTVACDGRHSLLRQQSGLPQRAFAAPPLDVWWFRISRRPEDPSGIAGNFRGRQLMVLIDRGDHYQAGYIIPKGTDSQLRAEGIEAFRRRLLDLAPWFGDRVSEITDFDQVKLLTVQIDRLRRWFTSGLLCIGDAAHAMSPIFGVGINLAIQDAVAAARILAPALAHGQPSVPGRGRPPVRRLAMVQLRRLPAALLMQLAQRAVHHGISRVRDGETRFDSSDPDALPLPLRFLRDHPRLQVLPAMAIGLGLPPEHAPHFARRPARSTMET